MEKWCPKCNKTIRIQLKMSWQWLQTADISHQNLSSRDFPTNKLNHKNTLKNLREIQTSQITSRTDDPVDDPEVRSLHCHRVSVCYNRQFWKSIICNVTALSTGASPSTSQTVSPLLCFYSLRVEGPTKLSISLQSTNRGLRTLTNGRKWPQT